MHSRVFIGFIALLAIVALARAGDIRVERVQFEQGSNNAVIEGSIKGWETIDYVLGAKKGQYMNASMATKNTASYFNVLAPGENEVAMFNGSVSDNQFEGILPQTGDYKVRVYMMRSAARREEVANYRLELIISDADRSSSGAAISLPVSDAPVGGANFHATGSIPVPGGIQ